MYIMCFRPAFGGESCSGNNREYRLCNTEPCATEADVKIDLRAEQCSIFDNRPIRGHYFTWLPYTDIKQGIFFHFNVYSKYILFHNFIFFA